MEREITKTTLRKLIEEAEVRLKRFESSRFRFSEEHKESLRVELRGYDEKNVEKFINILEYWCHGINIARNQPSITNHRDKIQEMLSTLEESLKCIKMLYYGDYSWHMEEEEANKLGNAAAKIRPRLEAVMNLLEKNLTDTRQGRGRPRSDTTDFVLEVAGAFLDCLGKPSTYESGPFANVIRLSLDALGLPAEDPSRAIKSAVKTLGTL